MGTKKKPSTILSESKKSPVDSIVAKPGLAGTIVTAVLGLIGVSITAYFGYLGIIASRGTEATPTTVAKKVLQRIDFDYPDSPENHGWQILDPVPITFTTKTDGYQGTYLLIESNDYYGMDTYVDRDALNGTYV